MKTPLITVVLWLALAATVAPQAARLAPLADDLARNAARLFQRAVPRVKVVKELETQVAKSVVLRDVSGRAQPQLQEETDKLAKLVSVLKDSWEPTKLALDLTGVELSELSWKECRATLKSRLGGIEKSFNICDLQDRARLIPDTMLKFGG